jgi:proline iminopeptidase
MANLIRLQHSRPRSRGRGATAWVALALAAPLGAAGGVAGFFAAALATSSAVGLGLAGLAACFAISGGLAAWATRRLWPAQRTVVALGLGIGTTLLLSLLAALTVGRPLAPPAERLPLPPQGGYWELPTGSRIAYLRIPALGRARATPIIRIHGGPGGYAVTNERAVAFFGQLARDGYDVYVYDQIGSGLSARLDDPREYTLTRSVADLEAIRQAIGADQLIVLGESWGATLAANYMAVHPDHVARVIFSSPAPINPAEWGSYQADLRARLAPAQQQELAQLTSQPRLAVIALLATLNPRAARDLAPDRELDGWMDHYVSLQLPGLRCNPASAPAAQPVHGFGFWAARMVGREFYEQRARLKPRALLAGNQTPTLILRGKCDHIAAGVADQYRATFAQSTLVSFPAAGHIIYEEQPERYLAAVRTFLRDEPVVKCGRPYRRSATLSGCFVGAWSLASTLWAALHPWAVGLSRRRSPLVRARSARNVTHWFGCPLTPKSTHVFPV